MRNSISESVSVATGKKKKMYAQTNVVSNERNFFFSGVRIYVQILQCEK